MSRLTTITTPPDNPNHDSVCVRGTGANNPREAKCPTCILRGDLCNLTDDTITGADSIDEAAELLNYE